MKWAATACQTTWEEEGGRHINVPFGKLSKVIRPKGGSTAVVMAGPGVGKTMLLLNWAAMSGMRTLYVSADTSAQDITVQMAALACDHPRSIVEERLASSEQWRADYAVAIFEKFPHMVFDFAQRPSTLDVRNKVAALTELWGSAPEFIVIDTASNIAKKENDSNGEWQRVWLESIAIARDFNSFLLFAHHLRMGLARNGRHAPELTDGLWGSDQFPEFVMGLHSERANEITLTVRKNRSGPKDVPVKFDVDFTKASVRSL